MTSQIIEYHDGTTTLQGYVSYAKDSKTPRPGVLICPDWTGRNAFADEKAKAIAQLGYVGFAVDVYGNAQQGKDNDEKASLMQPFIADRLKLQQRLIAAYQALCETPGVDKKNIAVIGFCFGGLCALDLARCGIPLRGAVSFHGLLTPPEHVKSSPIKAKILALHGYNDPMVSNEQLRAFEHEMTDAKADWQLHIYGDTTHAFTNPLANNPSFGTVYKEIAAQRAQRAMENFLMEIFSNIH